MSRECGHTAKVTRRRQKTLLAESISAGMMMLPSSVIARPFKILFFILISISDSNTQLILKLIEL
jgi:flagellar biosynthesis protein FliP